MATTAALAGIEHSMGVISLSLLPLYPERESLTAVLARLAAFTKFFVFRRGMVWAWYGLDSVYILCVHIRASVNSVWWHKHPARMHAGRESIGVMSQ